MVLNLVEAEFDSWKLEVVGKGSVIRVPFGSSKSQDLRERNGPRSGFEVSAELAGILKAKVNLTRFSRTIQGLYRSLPLKKVLDFDYPLRVHSCFYIRRKNKGIDVIS